MTLKEYLKEKKMRIADISRVSGVPYTTVSEIVNGKLDIDRVQIGTGIKVSEACQMSFDEFYKMCKKDNSLPDISGGRLLKKNKSFYLQYDVDGIDGEMYLCKINDDNKRYIRDMAEWTIDDIKEEARELKEIAEVESWSIDTI